MEFGLFLQAGTNRWAKQKHFPQILNLAEVFLQKWDFFWFDSGPGFDPGVYNEAAQKTDCLPKKQHIYRAGLCRTKNLWIGKLESVHHSNITQVGIFNFQIGQSVVSYKSAKCTNLSLSPGRATSTVPSPVVSASIPLSPGRGLYLPMQSQASYRSASSSPSARRPSSGFDVDNEEADARENVVVADGRADVRASAAMPDDNDDDANDGDFDDTLGELLGASFRVTPSLDLDLAFGAVNSNTDLACTHLLSPPSPLPPPLSSAPSSAAAGEPFWDPKVFTIIIIFFLYWWIL